ncbi:hypothetical protein CSKR_106017 [Clonorchis sinensis]|uniref:Uncharacterized protein n=1 Tax=Clonorchis sinensis TaxID=79923 RepID=A0A419PBV5_CLOSI|nr:hypothetical protein CSKR_106017 [Clonorchis sinensis]
MTSMQLQHSTQAGLRNISAEMNNTTTTPIPEFCQSSEALMSSFNYSLPSSLKSVLWGRPDDHLPTHTTSSFDHSHSLESLRPWYPSIPDQRACGKDDGFSKNFCYDSGGRLFYTDDRQQHEESSPKESALVLHSRHTPPLVVQHPSSATVNEMVPVADMPKLLDDSDSPSDFSLQNRSETEVLDTGLEPTTQSVRQIVEQRQSAESNYSLDEKSPYLKQLFCAKALFSGTRVSQGDYPNFSNYNDAEQKKSWSYSQYRDDVVLPQTEANGIQTTTVPHDISLRSFQNSIRDVEPNDPITRPSGLPHGTVPVTTVPQVSTLGRPLTGVYCPPAVGGPQGTNRLPRPYEPRQYGGAPRPSYHPLTNPFVPPTHGLHQPGYHPAFGNLRNFGPSGFSHHGHGSFGYGLDGTRRKNATRESTTTLKVWLQEHIKNPYPTKGEKIMLAIITKMTLTQVSTWFANARRRLKKENKMTWPPKTNTNTSRASPNGSRYPSSNTGSSDNRKHHEEDSNPDATKEMTVDEDDDDEDEAEGSDLIDDDDEENAEDGVEGANSSVSRPIENNLPGLRNMNIPDAFSYSSASEKSFTNLRAPSSETTSPGFSVNNPYFGLETRNQLAFVSAAALIDNDRTCMQLTTPNMDGTQHVRNATSPPHHSHNQHSITLQASTHKDRLDLYNMSTAFTPRPIEYMSPNLAYATPFNSMSASRSVPFPNVPPTDFDPLPIARTCKPPCSFTIVDQSRSTTDTYSQTSSLKRFQNMDPPAAEVDAHHTGLPTKQSVTPDSSLYIPSLLNPF